MNKVQASPQGDGAPARRTAKSPHSSSGPKLPYAATPRMIEVGAEVLAELSGEVQRARLAELVWAAMALAHVAGRHRSVRR